MHEHLTLRFSILYILYITVYTIVIKIKIIIVKSVCFYLITQLSIQIKPLISVKNQTWRWFGWLFLSK